MVLVHINLADCHDFYMIRTVIANSTVVSLAQILNRTLLVRSIIVYSFSHTNQSLHI
jgi:hypothetical protein